MLRANKGFILVGYLFIGTSLCWTFLSFVYPKQTPIFGIPHPEQYFFYGMASWVFTVLGASLWLSKKALRRRGLLFKRHAMQRLLRFFHTYHVWIGVLVFVTSLPHVVYFYHIHGIPYMEGSGWVAWMVLLLLFGLGLLVRSSAFTSTKHLHKGIAGLFVLTMLLHAGVAAVLLALCVLVPLGVVARMSR